MRTPEVIIVGSGPNGLAAAIVLARAGRTVTVLEARETIGGGTRTEALTLPGFRHDVCSAVHPLAAGSPLFLQLPLERHGLAWVHPSAPLAHPLDDGTAVVLERGIAETALQLEEDGPAWTRLMEPFVRRWSELAESFLGPPIRRPPAPVPLARFGLLAIRSASGLARGRFQGRRARALFAGLAAHSFLPLEQRMSAAFGLVLGMAAHAVGWPVPRGGSDRISMALGDYFRSLGGVIETSAEVRSIESLRGTDAGVLDRPRAVVLDLTPRQLLRISGPLPDRYRRRLARWRYGPGVFKLDLAIEGPIPWTADGCHRAGTVHLGGTLEEIAAAERQVFRGEHPDRPFVLLAQPSLFDDTRAPSGKHVVWAYCHVPNGSRRDMTREVEAQIERFAPGFGRRILARSALTCADLEARNPNLVGGDINGGLLDLRQFLARPTFGPDPYATPIAGVFLCSSSTPPGGGVHGMCGYHAARAVLRSVFAAETPSPGAFT